MYQIYDLKALKHNIFFSDFRPNIFFGTGLQFLVYKLVILKHVKNVIIYDNQQKR